MNFVRSAARIALTVAVLFSGVAVRAQSPPPVSVTFPAAAVVAAGLTPGGDVAIVSHALVWQDRAYGMVRRRAFLRADSSGSVRLNLFGENAPDRSLWIVMDVVSGRYAIASPNQAGIHLITLPETAYQENAQGAVVAVKAPFEFGEVAVVRPQAGAWTLQVMASGTDAITGGRTAVTAPSASLQGMGASPQAAPSTFGSTDVAIIVDPRTLTYAVAKFGGLP
jgi:hypothetical protein